MKKNYLIIIPIVVIGSIWCAFRTETLKEKNPTEYIFHTSLHKLRDTIHTDFVIDRTKNISELMSVQDISIKSWNILTVNSYNASLNAIDIFKNAENGNDFYLYSSTNPIISYSKMYKKFWKKLKYRAEFQLHFESIAESETKVKIITHDSKVLYWGFDLFGSGHSFVKYKYVEPTSIEEYEILLRIGKLVGEKNMPLIRLPE